MAQSGYKTINREQGIELTTGRDGSFRLVHGTTEQRGDCPSMGQASDDLFFSRCHDRNSHLTADIPMVKALLKFPSRRVVDSTLNVEREQQYRVSAMTRCVEHR